jgi:hypothetical protein
VKEGLTLRFDARAASDVDLPLRVRAGIALIYAHWEGFIKNSTRLLFEFVEYQRVPYGNLSQAFLAAALKSRIDLLAEGKKAPSREQFATFLLNDLNTAAKFATKTLTRTESNLSFAVFSDIASGCGVDASQFDLHAKLIDESLVKRRNSVAHGERLDVPTRDQFLALHTDVMNLMVDYREAVEVVAEKRGYLRAAD